AEYLVNDMGFRVDHQIAGRVFFQQERVSGVDRRPQLREAATRVEAAVDVDVERRDVVVGDADFGRLIGRDPFAVVAGNGGAQDVLAPGFPAVLAGGDCDARQAQARHVNVIDAARVGLRSDAEIGVAAPGPEAPGGLRDLVR